MTWPLDGEPASRRERKRVFQESNPQDREPVPSASAPVSTGLALVGFVGLCLLVGAAAGALTEASVRTWYLTLVKPPFTPPNWVFPWVWTPLYVMLGVSGWLAWRRAGASRPVRLWGWQLLANALWNPAFFGLHRPDLAVLVLAAMLVLTVATIRAFLAASRPAALLLVPYLLWLLVAAYLNLGIWWLNA